MKHFLNSLTLRQAERGLHAASSDSLPAGSGTHAGATHTCSLTEGGVHAGSSDSLASGRRSGTNVAPLARSGIWCVLLGAHLVLGVWCLVLPAAAQPATIPSAYLKTRFNPFTNAFTTNGIGGTNAGGIAIPANSALTVAGGGTNFTAIPLNRARGLCVVPWIQGTNLASATNAVTFNFAVSHDGTNFTALGAVGGLQPYNYTVIANGSNLVMGFGTFSANVGFVPGPYPFGMWNGATNGLISQPCPLDNVQWLMLTSITNVGSQPVWLHTNGVWWSAFP
jgi:hypothetical protein